MANCAWSWADRLLSTFRRRKTGTLIDLAGTLLVLVAFTAPGAGLVLLTSTEDRTETAYLNIFVLSLCYDAVVGLLLLRFGLFNYPVVLGLTVLPLVVALAIRGLDGAVRMLPAWGERDGTVLIPVLLAGLVVLGVVLTPRWTFLVSPNMDAGNYETYSNHFWTTGHLYLDADELVDRGVPIEWVRSHNTWAFDGSTAGRPNYLYAYPVLLGFVKLGFGSATVSWLLNALIGAASAVVLYLLARRFLRHVPVALAIAVTAIATPLFYYYTKQMMSEQLALLGFAVAAHGLASTDRRRDLEVALAVGGGVALMVLSKIDMYPAAGFLLLAALAASIEGRWRRQDTGPGPITVVAVGTALFSGSTLNAWLANPVYVQDKVSLSTYLPSFGSQSFDGGPLILIVTGAFLLMTVVWALSMRARPPNRDRTGAGWVATVLRVGTTILVLGWVVFGIWNLFWRPSSAVSIEESHNAYNLVRLFGLYSPVLLVLLFVNSPTVLELSPPRRWLILGAFAALGLVLFKSNHTPPDIWWMRRYLPVLLPVSVMVAAAGAEWLRTRIDGVARASMAGIVVALTVATGSQVSHMRSLFQHEVNVDAPQRLAELASAVPDDVPVVVTEADSTIRGMANTFRSLHPATVLLNVPALELEVAVERLTGDGPVAVISPTELDEDLRRRLDLESVHEGVFARQWSNSFDAIRDDPDAENLASYVVYLDDDGGASTPAPR